MEIDPFILEKHICSFNIYWLLCGVECYTFPSYSLMSVTNAISSVIKWAIIAALSINKEVIFSSSNIYGFLAIVLAALNIFGGFLVAKECSMYKKEKG